MKPEESGTCSTCRHWTRFYDPSFADGRGVSGVCWVWDDEHYEHDEEDTCPEYHKREEPT